MTVFDPDKDAANIAKHGVSLRLAEEMDMQAAQIGIDDRKDYNEVRYIAFGDIDGRLHALTFTIRDGNVRAISLRRARAKEPRKWLLES